ncbi:RWP-RK domain-containing [Micractinium conductrix]|uniref:RWP-RK domain-containing n=1 Tax=Micractinium conductrix TaxID=554055 RepID=A0A2P6V8S4_9CHLO|nr:RWP-RK domain-containing [Micractinium conductrix]|eukprot:PSC70490.1 RWP-RK domain-containing [Micractinium conductrix]
MVPAEPASTTSAGSPGGSCGVTPGGSPCMADACLPGPLPAPPCQQTAPLLHTTALAAPTDAASRPTRPLSASCPRPASAAQRSASASAGSAGGSAGGCMGEEPDKRLNLEFLEEHGYFDMPIQQAAAELHVGVTTLKKVCRVNNIGRWPFRKRSSLNRLIEKTKEYFASDPEQCAEALAQLEAQRTVLREQQGEDIPDQVKRFRQSIFKLDYKVKKIAKERRTHKAPGPVDREQVAQVVRQLGVGTPAHSILGILHGTDAGCEPPHRSLRNTMDLDLAMSE